ncbi:MULTISPECIES: hypothetical protein [Streptomyces]|uniref:hypothetical protein n=1 Tax=Streptomyces TaxID=1883 RepID=UPI001CCA6F9E|nr:MULTISPECIES: hypothetical protein [Streptomyces]UBI41386.1 hypothetical protein K7I03_27515 [Streptomyces mobaraensis]UKW33882.1 hypothetical protein MCU78_27450 [Streptomyces sp. TYQ1024]
MVLRLGVPYARLGHRLRVGLRGVEVFEAGARDLARGRGARGVRDRGADRLLRGGRAAVREGADDAAGRRVGRAHVERAAGRGGGGRRRADLFEDGGAGVPAARLMGAALGRLLAPGALGARHQEQVVLVGGVRVGEERVRGGSRRGAPAGRLGDGGMCRDSGVGRSRGVRGERVPGRRACVLRLSLIREPAGVGHAYPSPIGSAPSNRSRP